MLMHKITSKRPKRQLERYLFDYDDLADNHIKAKSFWWLLPFVELRRTVREATKHNQPKKYGSWWRHQMETSSALLAICAGNSPVTGEFSTQRPVTRSFDVFFLRPNKRLSKQSWGWWFETPSRPLWRHCNVKAKIHSVYGFTRSTPWWHRQMETFPRYWPFVRGIYWSQVDSPQKGQWRATLMLSLICTWTNVRANNRYAGDLRSHHSDCGVTMIHSFHNVRKFAPRDICPHWDIILVHTGSVIGLLPDSTKPLPGPMLTFHQWGPVTFTLRQSHDRYKRYFSNQLVKLAWKLLI